MTKKIYNATLGQIEEHQIDEQTGIVKGIDLSGETEYVELVFGIVPGQDL